MRSYMWNKNTKSKTLLLAMSMRKYVRQVPFMEIRLFLGNNKEAPPPVVARALRLHTIYTILRSRTF